MPPKILTIVGPTASGKTRLGVAMAQTLDGEVISADSMQVYRRMDIGTAKPTAREMDGVVHHMIDVCDPEEDFSVARYVAMAEPIVRGVIARGKVPVLVGGTGLYVDSLLSGRTFAAQASPWRARLQEQARREGIAPLLDTLCRVDPEAGARLHPADEKRIIRALEVYYETGKTITQHNEETKSRPPRFQSVTIALNDRDRAQLRARIDRRVDDMIAAGLAEEVRGLLRSGVSPACTAMQAIGYKELAAALAQGRDPAGAAEEVKLRTRQYAKRQITWFKRGQPHWFLWGETPDLEAARRFATEKWMEAGIG